MADEYDIKAVPIELHECDDPDCQLELVQRIGAIVHLSLDANGIELKQSTATALLFLALGLFSHNNVPVTELSEMVANMTAFLYRKREEEKMGESVPGVH